jgi:hypothetical protein
MTGLTVIAAATLAACSGGQPNWTGTVRDSAGISIVENPADGVWSDGGAWSVSEELRIGTAAGDADYQFGAITGIAVASDQTIYVLDQQASLIRAFDQSGTLQASFGSKGSGPGQLGPQVGPLLLSPGDTLYVPDMGNQRVSRFGADGGYLDSYRIRIEEGIPFKWENAESGAIVNQTRRIALGPDQPADSMDLVAARDHEGTPVDTLLRFRAGGTFSLGGDRPELKFFSAEPMWTLAYGGGLWHGINDDYRIGYYDGGALVRIVTKPFELAPVSEADQNALKTAMKNLIEASGAPPQAWAQFEQIISFADNFPAYAQFLNGPGGSLWVQHLVIPSTLSDEELEDFNPQLGLGAPEWDIFDSDGRFLGLLEMPARFQPLRFYGNRIYGIGRDELDVQYVMKFRIEGLPGGDTGAVPIAGASE